MIIFTLTVIAALVGSLVVEQAQCARTSRTVKRCNANKTTNKTNNTVTSGSVVNASVTQAQAGNDVPQLCFPAVGFKMPSATPTSLTNWWCNTDTEYAFVGFGYDISLCDFFYEINVF
jgi:hypothetical protein